MCTYTLILPDVELKDVEPADELLTRIMQQYSRQPTRWHVLNTPDGDMIVLGPESAFQLRLIPLSPYQYTGVGVELTDEIASLSSMRSGAPFGLRPLEQTDLRVLLDAVNREIPPSSVISDVLRREPLPPSELKGHTHVLSGPVVIRPDLSSLDPTIRRLKTDLDKEARKAFNEKYPLRAGMFF